MKKILLYFIFSSTFCFSQDGSLDLSFDSDGITTTAIGVGNVADLGSDMAIQNDGKIIVVGDARDGSGYHVFGAARYNTDGSLDNSFDSDGKFSLNINNTDSQPYSVLIQSDGKILIGGISGANFCIIRLNVNGSLDNSFDTDGIVNTPFPQTTGAASLALQTDGKILASGSWFNGATSNNDIALVRYNTDGSLDNTFDSDGKVTTNVTGTSYDYGNSVTVQNDGKILVAGRAGVLMCLLRYNSNGSLDNTFDSDGKVTTSMGSETEAYDMTLQVNDGKIVLVGRTYNSNFDCAIIRYNTDGSIDFSTIVPLNLSSSDWANSVAIQGDGKIVFSAMQPTSILDYYVCRLSNNGVLDNTFGISGIVRKDFFGSSAEFSRSVAIQSDGKIVAAGYVSMGGTNYDFAVARFNSSCNIPSQPSSISGNTNVCSGTSNTFSITPIAEATSYTWSLPSGWVGNSITNTISVIPNNTSGTLTVTANNGCGSSPQQTIDITVNNIPESPQEIYGPVFGICGGSTYWIYTTQVNGATSYTWSLPNGWSGTSTTHTINTIAGNTSGTISVTANNECGSSSAQTLFLELTGMPSTSSIDVTACDTYTAPDGVVYTTSGTKTAILTNSNATVCDSVITINLNIINSSSSSINATACNTYTAPDGAVYTTTGTKTAIIPNAAGCDSIITINLTIKNATNSTITENVCNQTSYTAPDGVVHTTQGIKTAIIQNASGCDSTITIYLSFSNITFDVTTTDETCLGCCDGTINFNNELGYCATPIAYNVEPGNISSGSGTITNLCANTYTVSIQDVCCPATTQTVNVNLSSGVGIKNNNALTANILYDNISGVLTMQNETEADKISILDLNGKTIFTAPIVKGKNQFSIENIASGVYAVLIYKNNNLHSVKKIVN